MLRQKITILIFILALFLPFSLVSAGSVLSSHKYAWSDNVGYINFEHVIVEDSALSGYAWSANSGFINFNPTQGGVLNDGTGNLSGSAWGEQLGWIDFDNVNIDGSGKFSGTATGTLVGTITFDCPTYCDVQTDWRVASLDSSSNSSSSHVTSQRIPNINSMPINLSSTIVPATLNVSSGNPIAVVPKHNIPKVVGGGPASIISAVEDSPLFDVISEPILSLQKNPISFFVFSIALEISLLILLIFIVRKIRLHYNNKRKNEN